MYNIYYTIYFSSLPYLYRVRVEFYVNENTLKERLQLYFIKNQRSSESYLFFEITSNFKFITIY
jgi:hypothetical protein